LRRLLLYKALGYGGLLLAEAYLLSFTHFSPLALAGENRAILALHWVMVHGGWLQK